MSLSRSHRPPPPDHTCRHHHRSTTATYPSNASREAFPRKHPRFIGSDGFSADIPASKRRRSVPLWNAATAKNYREGIAGNGPPIGIPRRSSPVENKLLEQKRPEESSMFMSRDEIERCSPSRRDGIDLMWETHLRYSYCAYIQNLGMRLQLPQTTIGTAMVLCHRFFLRRSHAGNDRFLIATAILFLAAKSEDTPCPLNSVLRASCEICSRQEFAFFPYMLHGDWFDKYRERVIQAENLILTTLDFELSVEHPYVPLLSVLNKLGLSQTPLLNVAWNLISEGLRSSLWLQFKPHHIAAGAVFIAAKLVNFDLTSCQRIWQEFQTTPSILQDVVPQLRELL